MAYKSNFAPNDKVKSAEVNANFVIIRDTMFVSNESLTSQITPGGGAQVFTLASSYVVGSVKLYISGLRKTITTDYTETGADEITIASTPAVATPILVDYQKLY